MNFTGNGMTHKWGSVRQETIRKENSEDLQSCIDVGQIMEKVQRDNYIRQQKAIEQTEGVSNNLMNWKKSNDMDMQSLENQMELLKKRREQIRQNSTEMTILASQLRKRLNQIDEMKNESRQLFRDEEEMQS
ncbi:hypothetical protein CRE_23921 [Caenorhabditis remanei]|uniref:Uncharacterized protein n=2 Tax=Caenorhabditis remanei TaxID=31234 RepID=E3MGG9_CAERE|nr:hypothetical protein CRE_23921 [Caenorhabditis remanei]